MKRSTNVSLKTRILHPKQTLDIARWEFFAYTRLGKALCDAATALAVRYPKNRLVGRIWTFCLPF